MLQPDDFQRFDAYMSGQLSPEETAELDDLLMTDDALLAAFEQYAKAHEVQQVGPAPPQDFTRDVRERIRQRSGGRLFQEDPVTKRYLPIFIIGAFALLVVVGVLGRKMFTPGIDDTSDVVEQVVHEPQDKTAKPSEDSRGRRVTDRSNRRNITEEELMRPASAGRNYKDLPLATGRMPSKVTYTRRVTMLKSTKDAETLRQEIQKHFGDKTIEQQDGYWRMRVDNVELSQVYERLHEMSGTVSDESAKVPQEEAEKRYLRFYYDMPKGSESE